MFQNKGFTMIEMLFVLSIIVINIQYLPFPIMLHIKTIYTTYENVQKQVGMMIDQAKQVSH